MKPAGLSGTRRGRVGHAPNVRRAMASLLLLLALGATGVFTADTAAALPGVSDCKTPPTPEVPGRGVVGFFEPAPAHAPAAADPFAPGSQTSIHDQYGYAGLRFNTYDLGCGPEITRSPDAAVGTTMANWIMTFPKATVAATGALLNTAYQPSFLNVFDPLVSNVVDALRRTVFDQWALVVIGALGMLIIWRARRASLASSTSAIGWALLVMIIATVLFRWPVEAGKIADHTVAATLSAVTGGLNGHRTDGQASAGAEATANLHDSLLYETWLGGTFGDTNSAVALKYGPKIFDAQALTWSEAETLAKDPAQGQRIIDAKQQEFKQAAAAVQSEDPDAYEYLVGRRSDTRVGYAVLAAVASLCAVPFLVMSALLVIGALVIVRFGVMLFPAFATLGMFPTMRHLIVGIANTMAAAVLNAIIFGIGSAVMIKAMGVVLNPATGLPAWLDVVLVLLLTIVMWAALSPFRRLTRMVAPNHDPFRDATTGVGRMGRGMLRIGGRVAGVAAGGIIAGRTAGEVVRGTALAGAGGGELTADDGLRAALSGGRRSSRAEATAPSWGAVAPGYGSSAAASAQSPAVPAEPAPPSRYDVRALAPAPAATTGGRSWSEASSRTTEREEVLGGSADPPRRSTESDRLPSWALVAGGGDPEPVEPEDHEGEQVYVLYRPGEADADGDLRDAAASRSGR